MRFLPFILLCSVPVIAQTQQITKPPRVFLLDAKVLQHEREIALAHPDQPNEVAKAARADADQAVNVGPFSVMHKNATPPSGDKHDYMSQAPYFWPNPATPNHLPYIRRDGERNPEIKGISDHDEMSRMSRAVRALALGYYLTNNEDYAARAALLLRTWFFDPATKMNPNLEYTQAIPGINTGRGIGIIESRGLTAVVDAAGLLEGSKHWTAEDNEALQKWFNNFLTWLQTSQHGKDESDAKNNHGSFYDVQVSDFGLFVEKLELAETILENAREKRIAKQIEPNGKQPLELARTKSFSYSAFNLRALTELAILGEHVNVDLWHFETKDGRSIRRALDFLIPYALGEKRWGYKQIEPINPEDLAGPLLEAASVFNDSRYDADAKRLAADTHNVDLVMLQAAEKTD
jgi:Alginate lyase